MSTLAIVQDVRDYFITCPNLDTSSAINIYKILKDPINYSIDPISVPLVIKEDILGNKTKQFRFYFTTVQKCDTLEQELEVQQFLENIVSWIETQEGLENYPNLKGTKIIIDNTPDLYSKDASQATGIYQIMITYTYLERNDD